MKIAISGASGFIGKKLSEKFKALKWTVIPLKRLDIELGEDWLAQKIMGADVIINLAGASVSGRWTTSYKKVMYNSRILTTRSLVNAINKLEKKPDLFISTSAIGIYDTVNEHDEESTLYASNFLSEICINWEAEAQKATIKTVICRLAVVMDKYQGAFPKMKMPFTFGMGGIIGNGKQYFSFIHIDDLVNAILFIMSKPDSKGIYNITSPNTITNKIFTKILSKKLRRPAFFRLPVFFLKLLFGEGNIILTEGQFVKPGRLQADGFIFEFDNIDKLIKKLS